jgi:hypothetical protein
MWCQDQARRDHDGARWEGGQGVHQQATCNKGAGPAEQQQQSSSMSRLGIPGMIIIVPVGGGPGRSSADHLQYGEGEARVQQQLLQQCEHTKNEEDTVSFLQLPSRHALAL